MNQESEEKKSVWRRFREWLHTPGSRCCGLVLLGTLLLITLLGVACAPERYQLVVGAISRQTIVATKDVVDEIATEAARQMAAAEAETRYDFDPTGTSSTLQNLQTIFGELRQVRAYGAALRGEEADSQWRTHQFTEEELVYAAGLSEDAYLTPAQLTTVMRAEEADFESVISAVTSAVEYVMNSGVRSDKIGEVYTVVRQRVGYSVDRTLTDTLLRPVLNTALVPNLVVNEAETAVLREAAEDAVEPIVYLQGQNIIREGEIVQRNQYEMARSLGLLQDDQYDFAIYYGVALLTVLAICVLALLLHMLAPEILRNPRKTAALISVLVISTGLCVLAVKLAWVYAAPMALAAVLATVLLGWRAGVSVTVSMTVLMTALTTGDSATTQGEILVVQIMVLLGGTFAAYYLSRRPQRVRTILSGLMIGLIQCLVLLGVSLVTSLSLTGMMTDAVWCLAGGLLSGLIALSTQPIFEGIFCLATPSKLLELANSNHPLLQRLLMEAPGTYHHAMVVANLAEAAADAVGADPILTRTGAYFHDVGKLTRPLYFKENQMGENPLDRQDPYAAAAIITAHPKDGVQLARNYRLPQEIQEIILQHHGDTPTLYFYHKAKQLAGEEAVDIADFRYAGPRPASKEAAIVMLADTVEAAIRSMSSHTPASIQENIERLVRGKLDDGQLSECPLSLKDIEGICEAFCRVLNGVFHERIEYPQTDVPKRGAFMTDQRQEAKPEPVREAKTEPGPEPKPESKPEPKPESKPEPKQEPQPEPKPEPKTEPKPEPAPGIQDEFGKRELFTPVQECSRRTLFEPIGENREPENGETGA